MQQKYLYQNSQKGNTRKSIPLLFGPGAALRCTKYLYWTFDQFSEVLSVWSKRIFLLLMVFMFSMANTLHSQAIATLHLSHDSTVRIVSESGNSSGSGFLIGDTLVLTCLHVVVHVQPVGQNVQLVPLQDLVVSLPGGEMIPAQIISFPSQADSDPSNFDFAFLRLSHKPTKQFSIVKLATDKEEAELGDDVIFSGFPLNTPGMVTHRGMVSGSNETKEIIFIEASVNKGNSGGALLNSAGHVVGIVSMREGGISEGLAQLRSQISATTQNGSVTMMGSIR
jgi:S1-C subfamily serine protease